MLNDLKPRRKHRVYDLVEQVGHDMTDWHASAQRCAVRANPKYCYEWSFSQEGKPSVLNLWHDMMRQADDGSIIHKHNFRPGPSGNLGQGSWRRRAEKLDAAVRASWRSGSGIRVIVNDGDRRRADNAKIIRSKVEARELDPRPWQVLSYDESTGNCVLKRV